LHYKDNMKVSKTYSTLAGVLFFSLFAATTGHAQDILTQMQNGQDVNVVFKKEALGGAFIHSQGWGLFFRNATILSIYRKRFWEIETASMHNPKEHKTQNSLYPDAKGYDYGKLNAIQIFRFGLGYYQMLYRKNNEQCVEVDAVYALGPSIAVAKPVYLQIIETTQNPNEFLLSTEKYDPNLDTPANIYGRASFFNGIGQSAIYPGGYARLGLNFDYANRHNRVKAIETGVEVDVYPKIIPIMAFTPNQQYFVNLYLSFSLGKRWF
jgi:hypothetical protein